MYDKKRRKSANLMVWIIVANVRRWHRIVESPPYRPFRVVVMCVRGYKVDCFMMCARSERARARNENCGLSFSQWLCCVVGVVNCKWEYAYGSSRVYGKFLVIQAARACVCVIVCLVQMSIQPVTFPPPSSLCHVVAALSHSPHPQRSDWLLVISPVERSLIYSGTSV